MIFPGLSILKSIMLFVLGLMNNQTNNNWNSLIYSARAGWLSVHHAAFTLNNNTHMQSTDKRADVWSRDFMIWKINFGLWAVAWAGLWNKRVWADYEQLLRPVFFSFSGPKKIWIFFCIENTIASALKSCIEKRWFFPFFSEFFFQKNHFFRAKNATVST